MCTRTPGGCESLPAGPGVSKTQAGKWQAARPFYIIFMFWMGKDEGYMLPKHGESTTERIKCKESMQVFVLIVASAEQASDCATPVSDTCHGSHGIQTNFLPWTANAPPNLSSTPGRSRSTP